MECNGDKDDSPGYRRAGGVRSPRDYVGLTVKAALPIDIDLPGLGPMLDG